jgi:hypothetical protein
MSLDDRTRLAPLLPRLVSLLVEVPLDAPVAVGVRVASPDDTVDFAFRHLDHDDVVVALYGFIAPSSWEAFGVVTPGFANRGATGDAEREPMTVCALVDRSGQAYSAIRSYDGPTTPTTATEGRAVDALRRCLGLPTDPPRCSPGILHILRWIDRVLASVLDADLGSAPQWPELSALEDPAKSALAPKDTWADLRRGCAAARLDVPGIWPLAAGWMDDGMFAREAIGAFAPLADTLGDLRSLLDRATFDKIVERVSHLLGQ